MAKLNDKIGPYTLVSKLGRGAFGVVWLAEKKTRITTTKVALKLPNEEDIDIEAIKNEAAVWVEASGHPNVLPIIEADVYDEQVAIVSEYAPDGSLAKWMARNGGKAPSIEAAVKMADGILAGLEHLHERKIIHRDLKPDNILLQKETPRLADFGIARILKTTRSHTRPTGTPWYMAPEAFSGKRSEQTDIWAVGVILYQLLVGSLPFPQDDPPSLMYAILTQLPVPFPFSIPKSLQQVIIKSLHKEPSHRYKSAYEMRQVLRTVNQPLPSAIRSEDKTERFPSDAAAMPLRNEMRPANPTQEERRETEIERAERTTDKPFQERPVMPVHAARQVGLLDSRQQAPQKPSRALRIIGIITVLLVIATITIIIIRNNPPTVTGDNPPSAVNLSNANTPPFTPRTNVSTLSPMGTVLAYYGAALDKDFVTARRYLSAGTVTLMEAGAKSLGKSLDDAMKESVQEMTSVPEFSNQKISGDTATVDIKSQGEIVTMPLVKENGEWKLAMDKLVEQIKNSNSGTK